MEVAQNISMKAIIGKKIGMSQVFDKDGKVTPVTMVEIPENKIRIVKTDKKDGYDALVIQCLNKKKEVRISKDEVSKYKSDQTLGLEQFEKDDQVAVSAVSKGKGFAGVIKKYGFSRGPETHGSDHHRHPGSIGSMFPQRVWKGKKMPGHMGVNKVTVKGLKVVDIHPEEKIILIKGALPGSNKSLVVITRE